MATAALPPAPATLHAAPVPQPAGLLDRVRQRLFAPVDIGMLAFFRIAFGVLMVYEAYRYLSAGWVYRNYIEPDFHFTFYGMSWVKPWPGIGMYLTFGAMALFGTMIAVGFCYRIAALLFALNFAHIFLVEEAYYLNHFYLITIISFMMVILPANRAWSVDAWLRPSLFSTTAPAWTLWLLRFQIGIAYFYGGIAKINPDWALGEPMRATLAEQADKFPLIGQWFTEEWMVWGFSWGGLLFDLLIVPALLWRRTRWAAFVAALLFNLSNSIMFEIGIFPWFMVCATMLFFPPDWVQVEVPKSADEPAKGAKGTARTESAAPVVRPMMPAPSIGTQKVIMALLASWVTLQVLLPFRHFLYPGDVSWTEEGHYFAWHMKLRRKYGSTTFRAVTPDGQEYSELKLVEFASPELKARMKSRLKNLQEHERKTLPDGQFLYISGRQRKKMAGRPDMILQYAHFLHDEFERNGFGDVAIYCDSAISLNGRAPQPLVDSSVNLAAVERSLRPASWIVPLTTPLPQRGETGASGAVESEE